MFKFKPLYSLVIVSAGVVAVWCFLDSASTVAPEEQSSVARPEGSQSVRSAPATLTTTPLAIADRHIDGGVSSKFVPWSRLTVRDSIGDAFKRAASTQNPEEAYIAIQIGVACLSAAALNDEMAFSVVTSTLALQSPNHIEAATKEMGDARRALTWYCKDFDDPENAAAIAAARKTVVSGKVLARNVVPIQTAGGLPRPPFKQEQFQALTMSLSNPGIYASAIDRILASQEIKHPAYQDLGQPQRSVAQAMVYWELTGDRDAQSLRNLLACSMTAICVEHPDKFVEPSKYQEALKVSAELLDLIRAQKWQQLGLYP